uniref:Uncharacterized protein n=1 Tax=Timema poppense TaxID=170557 RepID=A0A7R9H658_TIMPO|nr:unnamed protein product [Timema poppensis]
MFLFQFPQFQKQTNQVWLLLYDLYKRRFLPRDPHEEEARAELFDSCGLTELDAHLWSQHVRLAAAVARLRIKNNALKLSQLLPPHLRDEKVIALDEAPVTGWVNTCRTEWVPAYTPTQGTAREEISRLIERAGLVLSKNHDPLTPDEYRWDHVCPQFLLCHPGKRGDLAQSDLVRKHCVVLQDRAFCLGPATLGRLLVELQLTGAVLMTHINSPRTTAYLASLLAENDKIDALLAFGAGSRKAEYDEYLAQLCVRNTRVFAEKFVDLPSDTNLLEGVCAVLASPPNTYSGVMDPVDLVCSRGGDLGMLEVLTDPESASRSRVAGILEEQRRTLQRSMSQPQVQMVLYETHSIVPAENGDMVRRLVDEMNELARCRHVEEREGDDPPPNLEDVVVPPCDMFEVGDIVDVCKKCVRLEEEGCYLALIRRTVRV